MRAMVDLALRHGEGSVLLKDVAARQAVSLKYLEQLVTPLRAAGLVRGVRGARGGYMLAREPENITLSEIIVALEGPPAPVDCVGGKEDCPFRSHCVTHELWDEIYHAINKILQNRTLKEAATRQAELNSKANGQSMFYI
jgi:Rrf2 family protein